MNRKEKLLRNVLLILTALVILWVRAGKPLPLEWEYRRAEQAHFLEEKTILHIWEADGRVLSRDRDTLYLFQLDGFSVADRSIHEFPLTEGAGFVMAQNRGSVVMPMDFVAYEETGQAAKAQLRYSLTRAGGEQYDYEMTVLPEGQVFRFCLTLEPSMYTDSGHPAYDGNETETVTDIYEVYQGYRVWSDYELTITFLDEAGNTVAELRETHKGERYE